MENLSMIDYHEYEAKITLENFTTEEQVVALEIESDRFGIILMISQLGRMLTDNIDIINYLKRRGHLEELFDHDRTYSLTLNLAMSEMIVEPQLIYHMKQPSVEQQTLLMSLMFTSIYHHGLFVYQDDNQFVEDLTKLHDQIVV